MASNNYYITHNITKTAADIIARARNNYDRYSSFRKINEAKMLIVDDVEIPKECYPSNISQWSYNYISKTFNNMYGETAVDLLINLRLKVNWIFENADEATVQYWMGIINSRVMGAFNRDFKVNLYMPGLGFVESIWNTGAPITGQSIMGSGHDGSLNNPGSAFFNPSELLPDTQTPAFNYSTNQLVQSKFLGATSGDSNLATLTRGVTDNSTFEIHWVEKYGIRLNTISDIVLDDVIPGR